MIEMITYTLFMSIIIIIITIIITIIIISCAVGSVQKESVLTKTETKQYHSRLQTKKQKSDSTAKSKTEE